jgi:hypothetical protein
MKYHWYFYCSALLKKKNQISQNSQDEFEFAKEKRHLTNWFKLSQIVVSVNDLIIVIINVIGAQPHSGIPEGVRHSPEVYIWASNT